MPPPVTLGEVSEGPRLNTCCPFLATVIAVFLFFFTIFLDSLDSYFLILPSVINVILHPSGFTL